MRTGVKDAPTGTLEQQLHGAGAVERVERVHPHVDPRGSHQHIRGRVHLCTDGQWGCSNSGEQREGGAGGFGCLADGTALAVGLGCEKVPYLERHHGRLQGGVALVEQRRGDR